jgi:phytoene dehydrogenase-like protein
LRITKVKRDEQYDVAVIGGGHNGLVCSAYLARQGLKVCVIEKRAVVGGAALTEEFAPGFKNSVYSYAVSLLNPRVIAELELHRHGLKLIPLSVNGWKRFSPTPDGRYLALSSDPEQSALALDARARGDGAAFKELNRRLALAADVLRAIVLETPPNLQGDFGSIVRALSTGSKLRKLDMQGRAELVKLMTMSVGDYLDTLFDDDAIKGLYGYSAAVGNMQSPYSAGSAYVLLHHVFGEVNGKKGQWGQAIGGMGAITQAIASSAHELGVKIVTGKGVTEVLLEQDRAVGVRLDDGQVIRAASVVSNLNPRLLFTQLVDRAAQPGDFRRRMETWRCMSGVFRMNVALSELPDFTCAPGNDPANYRAASVVIAPSLRYLDQAFDDAKHGAYAKAPIIELQIPSIQDPTLAPSGQHVASMFCQYFHPHQADGRSWDDIKNEIADHIIGHYTKFAPNFERAIIARQIKSPLDIERDLGMIGGDIFHGALHLDQLFSMRPAPGYADYRTPIKKLYNCGSGTHPGGGVTGAPGRNAAFEVARDFKAGLRRLFH